MKKTTVLVILQFGHFACIALESRMFYVMIHNFFREKIFPLVFKNVVPCLLVSRVCLIVNISLLKRILICSSNVSISFNLLHPFQSLNAHQKRGRFVDCFVFATKKCSRERQRGVRLMKRINYACCCERKQSSPRGASTIFIFTHHEILNVTIFVLFVYFYLLADCFSSYLPKGVRF